MFGQRTRGRDREGGGEERRFPIFSLLMNMGAIDLFVLVAYVV